MSSNRAMDRARIRAQAIPVDDQGTGKLAMLIGCNDCGVELPIPVPRPIPIEGVFQIARNHGWAPASNGKHQCPNCKSKEKPVTTRTMPFAGASEKPPREMQPEDRRRIFRRLDEVYDEAKRRYCDAFTDHSVAAELNVPRAWVATVREDSFGPSGENLEMERFQSRIGALETSVAAFVDETMDRISRAEKGFKAEVADLRKELEQLRAAVGPRPAK